MKRIIIGIAILVVVVGAGLWIYDWAFKPVPLPSGPVSAVPLEGVTRTYRISQSASRARFTIHEILRGTPTNVLGSTNLVAGEVSIDLSDLAKMRIGEIRVDARGFATDKPMRNRVIHNRILNTPTYEFITFTPSEITDLSGSAAPSDSLTFRIAGALAIRDITLPVVFDAKVDVVSEKDLKIYATTTIRRADYKLIVPHVPFVADVGEEIKLEFDGSATAAP